MDAKFQPSFIPKQSVSSISRGITGHISVLYVIASIFFIVTLGLLGASVIAERFLNQDITKLNQDLITAKSSFELSTIEDLKKVSARTSIAGALLENHVALSKFIEMLGDITYANVSFSDLSITASGSGSAVSVTLSGMAASYNTIILQTHLFEGLPFLKNASVSDFGLSETGSVSFTFSANVEPNLVAYKRYVSGE
ncbi:MAG TPA: hypothetical protein VJH94_04925 [Candidatus Paceibacterota bacterium]